jgi:hypothetical protein
MSRSGYFDDLDEWALIRWRGAVKSAIHGKRGQAFLREMLAALDALPEKRLIRGHFQDEGDVCALGAVGRQRGLEMAEFDSDIDDKRIAAEFGIAWAMAAEIMFENDADWWTRHETPEQCFARMRKWVVEHIA